MAKSKFDASSEIEDLSYDLTKFVPGAAGVIPEPSDVKIRAFRKAIGELTQAAADLVPEDVESYSQLQRLELLAQHFQRDDSELADKLTLAIADVCSDHPSADEIAKLPYRPKSAFFGWISEVFIRPEASTPVTNR